MSIKSGYVTIVGKPNVGKSTLLNALLGQKLSIVSSKPQTTRKRILGILTEKNYQIVFIDTPGLLKPAYTLQEKMLNHIRASIKDADVLIVLEDIEGIKNEARIFEDEEISKILQDESVKKILVLNKIDLTNQTELENIIEGIKKKNIFDEVIPLSARANFNVKGLLEKIIEYLPEGVKFYPDDQISSENERFFVSEIIREKILEQYKEEIPYSVEVLIEEFKEREDRKDFIRAAIVVEKETQKPIVIGKGGAAIKKLGKNSRETIESFLGREVYLELRVIVRPKWRSDLKQLNRFGYTNFDEE